MIWNTKLHATFCLCVCVAVPSTSLQAAAYTSEPMALMTPAHASAIYRYLVEHHWVERTALFESCPQSADRKLAQQASLYEQGAMGLLAIQFGDHDRARELFHFLKETWISAPEKPGRGHGLHGLSNFYNAEFGGDGIEKTIHTGPNAWAGLFAARLANTTHDREALQWAIDVAYWLANAVPHQQGAVAMGPVDDPQGAPWARIFSTENNLSYYAFMTELLRSPQIEVAQRDALTRERDRVETWLIDHAIDRTTYKTRRGVSPAGADTIQALDTVTWLISAIGPRRLAQRGIDVEALMTRAAQSFEVTVQGRRGVDPTDQAEADFVYLHDHAKAGEVRRPETDQHRMIWYEGLGQYILALATMADYNKEIGDGTRAQLYHDKALQLTQAFDSAAVEKGAAFNYATAGRFFRDGWRPPVGAHGPCPSLIAGIWRCFAGLGFDPVAGRAVGAIQSVEIILPTHLRVAARGPSLLYGTSEEMTQQSWRAMNDKNWPLAIEQAQATVGEWAKWGLDLQERKMAEVGHVINYSGEAEERRMIFKYWALNDVAAAYFILGKSYDETGQYEKAAAAFQQIVDHYSLAQVWDPQGWFWAPVDAIRNDFVQRDPSHYGRLLALATTSAGGEQPN